MWASILDREMRDAARSRLASITERQLARPLAEDRLACSLMTGDVGRALFLAYAGEVTGDARARSHAARILVNAVENLEVVSDLPTFHAGFIGCAWTLEHLARLVDLPPDANDAIDDALREFLVTRPPWLECEWLTGAAGFTLYALERRKPELLADLLAYFEATESAACEDVGVAHGAAGVIAAVHAIAAAGVEPERAVSLADRLTNWLVTRPHAPGRSRFAVPAGWPEAWWTWCNGDLGIAGALAACGPTARSDQLATLASDIAIRIAAALADGDHPAIDGSLCHGWAGVAHILARVQTALDDDRIARAARRAFELAVASTGNGDDSLLGGDAGVGLVLLAATSDVAPAWDRALYLSVPHA